MSMDEVLRQRLLGLIGKGELGMVIGELLRMDLGSRRKHLVIAISSRFEGHRTKKIQGMTKSDEDRLVESQITNALLEFLRGIRDERQPSWWTRLKQWLASAFRRIFKVISGAVKAIQRKSAVAMWFWGIMDLGVCCLVCSTVVISTLPEKPYPIVQTGSIDEVPCEVPCPIIGYPEVHLDLDASVPMLISPFGFEGQISQTNEKPNDTTVWLSGIRISARDSMYVVIDTTTTNSSGGYKFRFRAGCRKPFYIIIDGSHRGFPLDTIPCHSDLKEKHTLSINRK